MAFHPKAIYVNKQLVDAKFFDLYLSNFVSNSLARNYITGLFFILLGKFLRLTFNRKLFTWIQQFVKRRKIFFLPERKKRNGWCKFFYGEWDIFSGSCFPAVWFSFLGKIQLILKQSHIYYHSFVLKYVTLSETQYDWRKIEQVTMKVNLIHFWCVNLNL